MVAAEAMINVDPQNGEHLEWDEKVKLEEEEEEKIDVKSNVGIKSEAFKLEEVNRSLLPDSPPHSPTKEEQALTAADYDQKRSGSSRQASLSNDSPKNESRSIGNGPTQYATHLPRAENKAFKTFERIKANWYQNGKVGRSKGHEKEAMVCECKYRDGIDDPQDACTEEADCINRVTQVECLKAECHCGKYCQNQRFQKGQYADVEVIETERKGFGLRAGGDISADQFIYEYIGEVVEQKEFMKRMEEYRDEGIRHFYFMMLQREEFLDATRKGGIARFVNHSCNPNCFVSKWHVGKFMRMGIFAKRDIQSGEELTFNYNVDRYGNDAQACYCGEPNCVGTIGGKTQTDIGGMEQLFIDALGISDQVDQLEAKGTRKKKSRHLDEDFTPILRPIEEEEVAKVITAVRQATSNRNILQKLLTRIHMTQDNTVQRCLVRLHGFVLMACVIEEWKDDKEVVLLAMGSLARWPLIARNKVTETGVSALVQKLSEEEDAEISSLAKDLLSAWDALESSYRIARKETSTRSDSPHSSTANQSKPKENKLVLEEDDRRLEDARAPNSISTRLDIIAPKRPLPFAKSTFHQAGPTKWKPSSNQDSPSSTPRTPDGHPIYTDTRRTAHFPGRYGADSNQMIPSKALSPVKPAAPTPISIEEIIRKANESEAMLRMQADKVKQEAEKKAVSSDSSLKRRLSDSKRGPVEKRVRGSEEKKEKAASSEVSERRLTKLVSDVVVRCMSTYKDDLDRDTFKKHAKELTKIICGKEMRSSHHWPPKDNFSSGLSSEKAKKIKGFALDYTVKLVARKGKGRSHSQAASTLTPVTPPRPNAILPTVTDLNGHSKAHQEEGVQVDGDDDDDYDDENMSAAMSEDNEEVADPDYSNTSVSPSANGVKGSDDVEASIKAVS